VRAVRLAKRGPSEARAAVSAVVVKLPPRDGRLLPSPPGVITFAGDPDDVPLREVAFALLLLVAMSGSFLGLTYETWRHVR
jgi:hypothetical protein